MSQQSEIFRETINNIITDLLNEGTYEDFINLQKNKTCNAHTLFLEQQLSGFKKVEVAALDSVIFLSESKTVPCTTEKCENVEEELNKKIYSIDGELKSKKQLCRGISIYFVRVFNLLAALMVGLDPDKNMCNKRILALYKKVKDVEGEFEISVCSPNSDVYVSDIMEIKGMSELLNLYQQFNVDGMEEYNKEVAKQLEILKEKMQNVFNSSAQNNNNNEGLGNEENNNGNNEVEPDEGIEEEIVAQTNKNLTKALNKSKNAQAGNGRNNGNGTNARRNNGKGNNTRRNNGKGNKTPQAEIPTAPQQGEMPPMPGAPQVEQPPMPAAPQVEMPPMPGAPQPEITAPLKEGININTSSSNSNSNGNNTKKNMNLRGGKRTKKQMRGGGGLFDTVKDLFGKKETPTPTGILDTQPQSTPGIQVSKAQIGRDEIKTLKAFRAFMERTRKETPNDMYVKDSQFKLKGAPMNYSNHEQCKKDGGLNRKVSIKNPAYQDYIALVKEMKSHYETSRQAISTLLLKLVDIKKTSGKYTLRQITSDELLKLEEETRNTLLNHYEKCQDYFRKGFKKLIESVSNEKLMKESEKIKKEVSEIDA